MFLVTTFLELLFPFQTPSPPSLSLSLSLSLCLYFSRLNELFNQFKAYCTLRCTKETQRTFLITCNAEFEKFLIKYCIKLSGAFAATKWRLHLPRCEGI